MMRHRHVSSEVGSLPLVLIAAIVLGGVVIVLTSQVLLGEQTARGDRDFAQAIHIADAGVQAAFTELASREPDDWFLDIDAADEFAFGTGDLGGFGEEGSYTWQARRVAAQRWEVRAEGAFGDESRFVEVYVGPRSKYAMALFGDIQVTVNGGGSTDFRTYDGFVDVNRPILVGTNNGEPVINGNVDGTVNPVCFGSTPCDNRLATSPAEYPDLAGIAFDTGVCSEVDNPPAMIVPAYHTLQLDRANSPFCVTQIEVNRGSRIEIVGAGTQPVDVYVAPGGGLDINSTGAALANKSYINVTQDQVDNPEIHGWPRALDLHLHFSGGPVDFGNSHTEIAASIYAPNSVCTLRAQGNLYGAAICKSGVAAGGLTIWYDQRLGSFGIEQFFAVEKWSEEAPGLSQFSWAN